MSKFRPMLAATATDTDLAAHLATCGHLLASAKLDGIRAIVKDGVVLSRSLKPIRNKHVQSLFGHPEYEGFDGELIVGPANADDVYRVTNSGVMSADGEPDVVFHVFDMWDSKEPFNNRVNSFEFADLGHLADAPIKFVYQVSIDTMEDLAELEAKCLADGYEGLIVRRPDMPYKHNRSTVKEGGMLKVKRFVDAEATVIGVVELMHNNNEKTQDERGFSTRSMAAAGRVAGDTMGALVCRHTETGVEFEVGTGFTAQEREAIWLERETVIGKLVKFASFPVGVKDKPRHPSFLGFRDQDDL